MRDDTEVVATFSELSLAELALSRLHAAGIPAELHDANTVGINWLYSQAIGGVRLVVPHSVAADAKAALAEDLSDDADREARLVPERRIGVSIPIPGRRAGAFLMVLIVSPIVALMVLGVAGAWTALRRQSPS